MATENCLAETVVWGQRFYFSAATAPDGDAGALDEQGLRARDGCSIIEVRGWTEVQSEGKKHMLMGH